MFNILIPNVYNGSVNVSAHRNEHSDTKSHRGCPNRLFFIVTCQLNIKDSYTPYVKTIYK